MTKQLSRVSAQLPPAPEVRIVHIGLGAFHRAHQAWYTQRAGDGWGIAAFTGRSPKAATELAAQDGVFTLVTRGAEGDSFELVESISSAHDGNDIPELTRLLARATTAIVTLTITEAGYKIAAGSSPAALDLSDDSVAADIAVLRSVYDGSVFATSLPDDSVISLATTPAKLVVGLAARRAADNWPIAVVPCDNLPGNGAAIRGALVGFAEQVDPLLAQWITTNVSFVDTSIDRITPRTTDADRVLVATETGFADATPVVTEPFTSWVLQGEFPLGRPAWENAGAQFVEDLAPFEQRKLWLLNGAHSLMAYSAQLRGHATVAEALADPVVEQWVQEFWAEASAHLQQVELRIPEYHENLRSRFANPRIAHYLAQIANDGTLKLAARAIPVYRAEQTAGREGTAALRLIAAWCDQLVAQISNNVPIVDPNATALETLLGTDGTDSSSIETTQQLVRIIDADLAADHHAIAGIHSLRGTFTTN